MTLSLHNPAGLPLPDPIEELAARLLFSAGLGAKTRAGQLLLALMRAATGGRVTIDDRTSFAAGCGMAESSLRHALLKLESLALVRTERPGPRQPLLVDLITGPRPALPQRQRQLELFPELAHVAEPPALRVAEDVATCPTRDVTAETGAGHVRDEQEVFDHDLVAMALRNDATQRRGAATPVSPAPPPTPPPKKSSPQQTLTESQLKAKWTNLFAGLHDEPGTALAIPDSSSEAHPDIPPPSAQQTVHADALRRAPARASPRDSTGHIVRLVERITSRVRVDRDFAWLPWSAALLAVDGPLSEHDLHECIAGCHGDGKKFTGALYRRLHTRDPPELAKRTLLMADGRVQLHRFGYLRRALRRYGVNLDRRATQSPHHHIQPTQGRT